MERKDFVKINKGDFLLFSSGAVREVIDKTTFDNGITIFLTFNKIKGFGTTVYLYADIGKKIIGKYKLKNPKSTCLQTNLKKSGSPLQKNTALPLWQLLKKNAKN